MTAAERLIAYYQDSYQKLLDKIARLPAGANWKIYYQQLQNEIDLTVKQLNKAVADGFADIVKRAYISAETKALDILPSTTFSGLNREAMRLIAENAVDELTNANYNFGVRTKGRLRQIGLDAAAEKLSAGQTTAEVKRRIMQKLSEEGMTAMTDAAGRHHRLDTYADTVCRTTVREATNTATISTIEQLGHDLVKISEHWPTCDVCAKVQGRVFSISGKDKRFPPLSSVPGFDKGFKTIHPKCSHVLIPTVEALWTDEEREKYLGDAEEPLRGETRSQKEVDRYNAIQAEKRIRRQDLRQWERYRVVLGDDAPNTFNGFRTLKGSENDKWTYMQRDYKRRIRLNKHPELALPNAKDSYAESNKFTKYFYNPHNKDGFTKGMAFESRLGYNKNNWKEFQSELVNRSSFNPSTLTRETEYGKVYEQKMVVYGLKQKPMDVMAVWEVRDAVPRLITAFPH